MGDASRDDGIVILVAVDDRVTQIETGPGVALSEGALDAIRSSGNAFFADGDFEGGILAMLSALEVRLESGNGDGVGTDAGEEFSQEEAPAADDGSSTGLVMLGIIGVAGGATALVVRQRSENRRRERRRRDQVDSLLARLDVSGHEMPQLVEFALPAPAAGGAVTTGDGLLALAAVSGGERTEDVASVEALWAEGMIAVIDATALDASTEVPLELAASGEGDVLEESVQASARAALRIDIGDRASFDVAAGELQRLVDALRPYRVASARRRAGEQIIAAATDTAVGFALLSERGERFLRAGAAMDEDESLAASVAIMDTSYDEARTKTDRLSTVYDQLSGFDRAARSRRRIGGCL